MRYFIDTEFHEDGRIIDLISIAVVPEEGRPYYAVSSEFDPDACSDWVKQNVLPHLADTERKRRARIAEDIKQMVLADGAKPEFWGYFADYDWVLLCQLYGRMIDLPKGFPFFCMDLKQLMVERGRSKDSLPPQTGTEHNALADAAWIRCAWQALQE